MAERQDNVRLTVSVDGRRLGVWEDRKGGAMDSSSTVYPRGGMGPRQVLGGRQEPAPVTLTRLVDDEARSYKKWLKATAGKGRAVVTEQELDDEQNALGDPEVWSGQVKMVSTSDRAADSAAAETIDMEVIVETIA